MNMFYVHPYLGKISNLTSIFFEMGWFNHQLVIEYYRACELHLLWGGMMTVLGSSREYPTAT